MVRSLRKRSPAGISARVMESCICSNCELLKDKHGRGVSMPVISSPVAGTGRLLHHSENDAYKQLVRVYVTCYFRVINVVGGYYSKAGTNKWRNRLAG